MAAATVDGVASKIKDIEARLSEDYAREILGNVTSRGMLIPYGNVESIPATSLDDAGDIFRLSHKFPSDTVIWQFAGTPGDGDSGANLVYDIVWVTEAGTTAATLVSGSTKAQAASGSDALADSAKGVLVGEGYLALKVTTGAGAGAAAMAYHFGMTFSRGWLAPRKEGRNSSSIYQGNARA